MANTTTRWRTVTTFESDGGDPVVVRGEVVNPDPSSVARRAVFRACTEVRRTRYESIVVVLDRLRSTEGRRG